jgi:hypothetical protein
LKLCTVVLMQLGGVAALAGEATTKKPAPLIAATTTMRVRFFPTFILNLTPIFDCSEQRGGYSSLNIVNNSVSVSVNG